MKKLLMVASIILLGASMKYGKNSGAATANLSVTVGAEAAIVVNSTPRSVRLKSSETTSSLRRSPITYVQSLRAQLRFKLRRISAMAATINLQSLPSCR